MTLTDDRPRPPAHAASTWPARRWPTATSRSARCWSTRPAEVRFADRNRVKDGDETRHPEFEIAKWSARHLTAAERAAATVYTSGEHCPMCSAAHAWMGLGRIVYAVSSATLSGWLADWGVPPGAVLPLPINAVAPDVPVDGPAPELEDEMKALHRQRFA